MNMNPSHYVDIAIREATVSRELHARLLTAVHYQIKAENVLGVTWPDWKPALGEFGLLFRAFGSEEGLADLSRAILPLGNAGLVRIYPVTSTPNTPSRVRFARNRQQDKHSPSRAARRERRALARGEVCAPPTTTRSSQSPHFLRMQSASTNAEFSLYVTRHSASMGMAGGSQYGLGYALPDF